LVLAGLTRTENVKQKQGMPWLSDIPVLGYAFGGETTVNRVRNVLVTLDVATVAGLVDAKSGAPLTLDEVAKIKGDAKLSDKERFDSMAPIGDKQLANNSVMKGLLESSEKLTQQVSNQSAEQSLGKASESLAEEDAVSIPDAKIGFDQWLLDPAKK
jgi:hypothetical protein